LQPTRNGEFSHSNAVDATLSEELLGCIENTISLPLAMCGIDVSGRRQPSFAHRNGRMFNPKEKFNIEDGIRNQSKA
jgi:hypothetical protein